MAKIQVTELIIYPIKSCQGIRLEQVEVTAKGLQGDRQFMLVDPWGKFLTQRQYPQLARIAVTIDRDNLFLSVTDEQLESFCLQPRAEGREISVEIWRDHTAAIDQGDAVASWFQKALYLPSEFNCRLVKQSQKYPRLIDKNYRFSQEQNVSFADGYPILLTNTASLTELNQRLEQTYLNLEQTIPMNRFRPNIVVETNQSFAEDCWQKIKINQVSFAVVKPCSRCIVITTDQFSGVRNKFKEPLQTLTQFRQIEHQGIIFGQNLIPLNSGMIEVGSQVSIEPKV